MYRLVIATYLCSQLNQLPTYSKDKTTHKLEKKNQSSSKERLITDDKTS